MEIKTTPFNTNDELVSIVSPVSDSQIHVHRMTITSNGIITAQVGLGDKSIEVYSGSVEDFTFPSSGNIVLPTNTGLTIEKTGGSASTKCIVYIEYSVYPV